ncbi:MAG: hypothetical protein D6715_01825 [Calditrichaeota bacterium]|nr:MAG: hypothetical protein D6715_01825 [Calditrichota bacterium]
MKFQWLLLLVCLLSILGLREGPWVPARAEKLHTGRSPGYEGVGQKEALPALELVEAIPLHQLLPEVDPSLALEASGVVWTGGALVVAFDNLKSVALLHPPWAVPAPANRLTGPAKERKSDFEGLAYDSVLQVFYLVRESKARKKGHYARIHEWDGAFEEVGKDWVRLPFRGGNKGYEGLAFVRRQGKEWLLALRETAQGGPVDSTGGPGVIDVLTRRADEWEVHSSFQLPGSVRFLDYAGLDVQAGRMAVLSQASARVWLGRLHPQRWAVADSGAVYTLPTGLDGRTRICRAEGICWLNRSTLAVVTDRNKRDPDPCRALHQHLIILKLP